MLGQNLEKVWKPRVFVLLDLWNAGVRRNRNFFLGEVYSGGGGVPRERVLKQSFEILLLLFF